MTDWAVARTLTEHAASVKTAETLSAAKWDFVILQEQTQIPSVETFRSGLMYPAARRLVSHIREAGAVPMFFQTSAARHGWPENGLNDYLSMQAQINLGYATIAGELDAPVAPVGQAWQMSMQERPQLNLWQDGKHPNVQGAYLAACVFYAAIFKESPEGLDYHASLSQETARFLQKIAADAVLKNPAQWNLE